MQPTRRKSPCKRSGPNRRGLVLLMVMLCLVLVAAVGGAALRATIWQQRQLRREALGRQADWLAEAALDRAFVQVLHDPQYTGETWTVPAAELASSHAAKVAILVEPVDDQPDRHSVSVVVEYPDEGPSRVRVSRTLPFDAPLPE